MNGMQFYAFHGCFAEEQSIGTYFRVDVVYDVDTTKAQKSDCITDTVSYLDVYQVVKREMAIPSNLLEHVARRIGEGIRIDFPSVTAVRVKVSKLNPPLGGQMESVSVEVSL